MPIITRIRPTAKVMLPAQSIRAAMALAELLELQVGPDGAEEAEGHGDEEHQPPVDGGEHAAENQADEGAADAGDVVDAEREAALVGGEGVGEDGGGVGDEERGADALDDAADDQPERAGLAA